MMACHSGMHPSHMLYSTLSTDTPIHRYKAPGANAVDETGARDNVEFINVSQDDALAWPTPVHRTYPSTVNGRMDTTIVPFMRKSAEINSTIMEIMNAKLGLPAGTLNKRHLLEEHSGSEARCIKSPPRPGGISEEKAALGAHTDFGSLVRLSIILASRRAPAYLS